MILFIIINFLGILLTFFSIFLLNKKHKILSSENIILSFILFLIFFFAFSKIGFILINLKIDMKVTIYFITSNHAFIGGYIGTLIFLSLVCKLFN